MEHGVEWRFGHLPMTDKDGTKYVAEVMRNIYTIDLNCLYFGSTLSTNTRRSHALVCLYEEECFVEVTTLAMTPTCKCTPFQGIPYTCTRGDSTSLLVQVRPKGNDPSQNSLVAGPGLDEWSSHQRIADQWQAGAAVHVNRWTSCFCWSRLNSKSMPCVFELRRQEKRSSWRKVDFNMFQC